MTSKKKVIVIVGATGTGKTLLATACAAKCNGEIISADSRQVYKYLDVGTNKAGRWDEARKVRIENNVPQHLTDIIEPAQIFSAGHFVQRATVLIDALRARGKTPIIVGGTGLYIKALIDGLAPLPERNEQLRAELLKELEEKGREHLYERLRKLDPVSAEANRQNTQRLIRALEVVLLTGTPISTLQKNTKPSNEDFAQFGLLWDKEELYSNLDRRTSEMLKSGMIEETKKVLALGFSHDCPGLQSLGYRDIVKSLHKEISKHEVEIKLQLDTRHYAKRQMTWFKKDPRITWLRTGERGFNANAMASDIMRSL